MWIYDIIMFVQFFTVLPIMYGAFDVVLDFVIIQLFWLLINLLLILSYLIHRVHHRKLTANKT